MSNKTFRLFISSPFSDFTKEREVLHTKVFPEIDKYCHKEGLTFQPVDLRWGVNEEAQLDQKTLEVCLEEVKACKHFPHPNFLIMAGDRYGYIPLPYMIEKNEFEKIIKKLDNESRKIEYWEHDKKNYPNIYGKEAEGKVKAPSRTVKQPRELLAQWYQIDENQLPTSYILQVRQENENGNYLIYENWAPEENTLRDILQEAIKDIDIVDKEKYYRSATEAEVIEGICEYKNKTSSQEDCDGIKDKKYVLGYTRTIKNIGDGEKEQIFLDRVKEKPISEQKAKADTFKKDLQELLGKNIFSSEFSTFSSVEEYQSSKLEEFAEFIEDQIKNSIDEQLNESKEISKLQQEISQHQKFLQDKVKGFQGRVTSLNAIENYLKEKETTQPLVVHGVSGMGKSSLMAKAIETTQSDNKVFRFVGATADSSNIRTLLISITEELQYKKLIDPVQVYETDSDKFEEQIKDILSSIDTKTILFIDALDQLQHINYLNWLPGKLPSELKIIFSVLNDDKYDNEKTQEGTHYHKRLMQIYPDDNTRFIDITEDSLGKTKESLVEKLLEVEGRKLNKVQTDYLLKQWEKTQYSPLYLKIAIEEVKHWRHCESKESTYDDKSVLCEKQVLNDDVEGVVSEYLDNLVNLYHHEELLIKKVFGYIHASKDGLSERELLQILSEDLEDENGKEGFQEAIINEWHKPIKVKNPRRENKEELVLPISIWSRLHTQIKPFIIERTIDDQPLMKFFHREFTNVIGKRYKKEKIQLHTKLASYFDGSTQGRKMREVPWNYYNLDDFDKLSKLLYDPFSISTYYKDYKSDLFLYHSFLSKYVKHEKIIEDYFKLQKTLLKMFDKSNKEICNEVSARALHTGMFYNDIGKFKYSKEIFSIGIHIDGDELLNNVLLYIGTLIKLNEFNEALEVIHKFMEDRFKETSFFKSLTSLKAVVLRHLGKYNDAIELYDEIESDNMTILYNKAVALKDSGEKDESKNIFEKILSSPINDFEFRLRVQNSYGSLLKQLGQINEGYKLLKIIYKEAVEYFPKDNGLLLGISNNYSKVCIEIDDVEIKNEALIIQEQLLNSYIQIYGDSNHENILLLKHNLSETNFILGKNIEAKQYAKGAYEGRKELLGVEHKDTILSLLSYFKLILLENDFDKELLINLFEELYKYKDLIISGYDKKVLDHILQIYCNKNYSVACNECSEVFFNIANYFKNKNNYKEALEYDIKCFECSVNNLNTTKKYHNFITVSTRLAETYYKLNLKDKVIEIEKTIVDILRANYDYIFKDESFLSITQFIKSIKNLSESLQDNENIEEAIQYMEEVLDLRYKLAPQVTKTLDLTTGDLVENDVYGIYKIELDEYVNSLNQLAAFAYKNDLLDLAEKAQQKAIDQCIENLEVDYEKYLQMALNYYSDLAAMFLFSNLSTAKIKYNNALSFIQTEFTSSNLNEETCIQKQQSVLNGIKLLLSNFLETQKEVAIDLNNLLIDLYMTLCVFNVDVWTDDYIEQTKMRIRFLKDKGQLNDAIKYEIEVGQNLRTYQNYIENWQEKMVLHLNNLATNYYNLEKFEDAEVNALSIIDFFKEHSLMQDLRYDNAQNIIKLIKQKKEQKNGLNHFLIKDTEARDVMVKVLFLLQEPRSDIELNSILIHNGFTENTPYDYHVISSNEEMSFIQQYYGELMKLPLLIYYLNGDVEFILPYNENKTIVVNHTESRLTDLLELSKIIAVVNGEDEISVFSFISALGFIELNKQGLHIFSQIANLEQIARREDASKYIKIAQQSPVIPYSEELNELVEQLNLIFNDMPIGILIKNPSSGVIDRENLLDEIGDESVSHNSIYNAKFSDLLELAKFIAYHKGKQIISVDEYMDAVGFIELNQLGYDFFSKIMDLDHIGEQEDAMSCMKYSMLLNDLLFEDNLIGSINYAKLMLKDNVIGLLR